MELQEKLLRVQNGLKAPKTQRNNFGKYNYRNCEDILEAVKPLLLEQGLTMTITDEVKELGGYLLVEASVKVYFGNDNFLVTAQAGIDPNRKGMDIAQSFGSSSSYARKYALNGMFLIDDTKDADTTNQGQPTKVKPNATSEVLKNASKVNATIEQIKSKYSITALQETKFNEGEYK
tara:strand:- start:333 stop:863 length:531 start_codon:yes stop_codon:yes gene_type:complete